MSVASESTAFFAIVGTALLLGCGGATFASSPADGGERDAATVDAGHGGRDAGADAAKAHDAAGIDAKTAPDGGTTTPDAGVPDGSVAKDARPPDASAPDASVDSGQDSGSVSSTGCPVSPPTAGVACSVNALECEYGSDPSAACDTLFTCASSAWMLDHGPATTGCNTTNSATCPMTFADVPVGMSCTGSISCDYPQARCDCRVSPPLATPQWNCDTPDQTGCPLPRPRIGSACSMDGLSCDYGYCSGGVSLSCTDGTWVTGGGVCPG